MVIVPATATNTIICTFSLNMAGSSPSISGLGIGKPPTSDVLGSLVDEGVVVVDNEDCEMWLVRRVSLQFNRRRLHVLVYAADDLGQSMRAVSFPIQVMTELVITFNSRVVQLPECVELLFNSTHQNSTLPILY